MGAVGRTAPHDAGVDNGDDDSDDSDGRDSDDDSDDGDDDGSDDDVDEIDLDEDLDDGEIDLDAEFDDRSAERPKLMTSGGGIYEVPKSTGAAQAARSESSIGLAIYIAPMDPEAYEALSNQPTFPTQLEPYQLGKMKNRYWDILPNPITRVKLPKLVLPGESTHDGATGYINANFVRGYGGGRARG